MCPASSCVATSVKIRATNSLRLRCFRFAPFRNPDSTQAGSFNCSVSSTHCCNTFCCDSFASACSRRSSALTNSFNRTAKERVTPSTVNCWRINCPCHRMDGRIRNFRGEICSIPSPRAGIAPDLTSIFRKSPKWINALTASLTCERGTRSP